MGFNWTGGILAIAIVVMVATLGLHSGHRGAMLMAAQPVKVQATTTARTVRMAFSRPIPLPMAEADASALVQSILRASAQGNSAELPTPAHPSSTSPTTLLVGLASTLLLLIGGLAFRRPLSVTPSWRMAASAEESDDNFDVMVERLKKKGQEKAGVGFSEEAQKKKEAQKTAAVAARQERGASAIKSVAVKADEPAEDFSSEELFVEVKPSPYELVIPLIGTLFVIGIFPLATGVVRQLWVRYKITSRRVCITSGWGGQEYTEVSFKKIKEMKYVRRHLGADGDLVVELVGGGAVDMQSMPDFVNIYNYIFDRISPEAQERSMKLSRTA